MVGWTCIRTAPNAPLPILRHCAAFLAFEGQSNYPRTERPVRSSIRLAALVQRFPRTMIFIPTPPTRRLAWRSRKSLQVVVFTGLADITFGVRQLSG